MHLTGGMGTMHKVEPREDIIASVISYFDDKKKLLSKYGIENWVIDPGFGFGKTVEENFTIVKKINELKIWGFLFYWGLQESLVYIRH